jgi:hypothetical protein
MPVTNRRITKPEITGKVESDLILNLTILASNGNKFNISFYKSG